MKGQMYETGTVKPTTFAKSNRWQVMVGTIVLLGISAVPFAFKTVREREANVHKMRDAQLDAKDNARDSRLRVKTKT